MSLVRLSDCTFHPSCGSFVLTNCTEMEVTFTYQFLRAFAGQNQQENVSRTSLQDHLKGVCAVEREHRNLVDSNDVE